MSRLFEPLLEACGPPPGHALGIPENYVGPYVLGSGRMVYWTGRVAIGLCHRPTRRVDAPMAHGAAWIQGVMLRSRTPSPAWLAA